MKQQSRILNILVLFAGAGLATRGLLDAGHSCTDVEIAPAKSHLSRILNPEANHIVCDVMDLDPEFIASFDAVWASPPCQGWSDQNHGTADESGMHLLEWAMSLENDVLWVENVISRLHNNDFGIRWNAAQFEASPTQRRRRMIGGHYRIPYTYRVYQADYPEYRHTSSPAVLASEYKQGGKSRTWKKERRKFTRWFFYKFGRMPGLADMAHYQGFVIPDEWQHKLDGFTERQWMINQSQAIGNGVPVYMSRAFGEAYSHPEKGIRQLPLFEIEPVTP